LGRPGRRRCDRPWWERRRLEVEGGADRWDLVVSDWERGRERWATRGLNWAVERFGLRREVGRREEKKAGWAEKEMRGICLGWVLGLLKFCF
jgi:hypothetical protein